MSNALLPLKTPPVAAYLHHGYPMSIMMEDPRSLAWIYSHYIQLYFQLAEPLQESRFDFYHYNYPFSGHYICPFIYHRQFSKKTILRYGDFDAFIAESLEELNYVHLYCDEYYLPHRAAYGRKHQIHGNLIYGFDSTTREYAISGYDENGTFRNTKASYRQMKDAIVPTDHFDVFWYDIVMHYARWDAQYEFDVSPVIELLKDYVLGRDTSLRYNVRMFTPNKRYGKDVYPLFARYIEAVRAGALGLDIRHFHLLWEHKKLMLDRIRFLIDNGCLAKDTAAYEAYEPIERACFRIRGDALKASAAQSASYLESASDAILSLCDREVEVLSAMIEELETRYGGQTLTADSEWEGAVEFQF